MRGVSDEGPVNDESFIAQPVEAVSADKVRVGVDFMDEGTYGGEKGRRL